MPVLREIQYEKKNQNDFVPNNFGMSQAKKNIICSTILYSKKSKYYFLMYK